MKLLAAADVHLTKRKPQSHKGENGSVLVVAGSLDYIGAAYLAGRAALRAGVDKVLVAAPERVAWALNCLSADMITMKFRGDFFSVSSAKKLIV